MTEEFKCNFPAYYHDGKRICLASSFKSHVTVELFCGACLNDPQVRLEGVGKSHIELRSKQEMDSRYFIDMVRQSIELSETRPPKRGQRSAAAHLKR